MWSRFHPILLLGGVAVAMFLFSELQRVERPLRGMEAAVAGTFTERGGVPCGQPDPKGLRCWSSFAGSIEHRGTLTLGPFSAPATLGLRAAGFPRTPGNGFVLENLATGESFRLPIDDVGDQWRRVSFRVPKAWRGESVLLRVVDDSDALTGWLALSELHAIPWWAAWGVGVWPIVNAILFTGLTILVFVNAAGAPLGKYATWRGPGLLLHACAAAALLGYGLFWIFFVSAEAGRMATGILFVVAVACSLGRARARAIATIWRDPDWFIPVALMAGAAVLFTALLFLFSVERPWVELAQNRYREQLPGDNELPRLFAERLRHGEPLKPFANDWLSSDRPPLQTGWILLFGRGAPLLGAGQADSAHFAALWLQLLWIPAVWMWLRHLGAGTALAALVIVGLMPAGFFMIHSVYVWPKLAAAALLLGAWAQCFLRHDAERTGARFAAGGGLAALAFLAHGGVAFALLALVPQAMARWSRPDFRRWALAGAVFVLLILPWPAYQKFHDPPGNRLLKWHLAGVVPVDDRGTLETIVAAYRATPVAELWHYRVANLRTLIAGRWSELLRFDLREPAARRDAEFFHPFFALGWWSVGLIAFAYAVMPRGRARFAPDEFAGLRRSFAWVGTTLLVWWALMFLPGHTVIHQGSYTVLLVLFPALALSLWRLHPCAFVAVLVAQMVAVPSLWMTAPPGMADLPHRADALLAVLLASLVLAAIPALLWWRARVLGDSGPSAPTLEKRDNKGSDDRAGTPFPAVVSASILAAGNGVPALPMKSRELAIVPLGRRWWRGERL